MTWAGYWLPHLIDWVVGGSATTAVGLLLRRAARIWADEVRAHAIQAARAAQGATTAAQGATTAAVGATVARTGAEDALARLTAAEAGLGGVLEAVSASLGHRARDDLRFREIEARLDRQQGGRHAAAIDHSQGD